MTPIFKAVCIESSINPNYPDGIVEGNIYNISTLSKDSIIYYVVNDDRKICGTFNKKYFKTLPEWRDECIDSILK